ncbi:hypothetical protein H072_9822 [Dactylellina haptotyla CBS 200.50]|uniref:PQ loop repeat protein n=1 Tax=Dactylellina haptotyla (strain CBS 200.50) TaxID=1284197 RepID=S8BMZ4_DACHA|nr:hypothetical protein H072_9822 [Dactylellina haptotyla CBS 200.50]
MDNPIAANVLGTTGAICWSVQLIPQIIINYRRHHTTGLQPSMMLLWAFAGIPLGIYNIVSGFNIALQIQPQILTFLSLVTWAQCQYYGSKWGLKRCISVTSAIGAVLGGVEVGLIFALRIPKRDGSQWPLTLMAVLSAVFLSLGVLTHYWDIYKHKTVRGISFIFVFIDALGDLTSLISIFFEKHLDVLGMVIYGSELVLWIGVMACGGWFNLKPWLRRWAEKKSSGDTTPGNPEGRDHTVVMHDLPSSTSVFRTPSASDRVATRRTVRSEESDV